MQTQEVLTVKQVIELVGIGRTTIWRLERQGLFPARRRLSAGRVGYLREEILAWINSRPELGGQSHA